jgi:DNA end-binding protein Ku
MKPIISTTFRGTRHEGHARIGSAPREDQNRAFRAEELKKKQKGEEIAAPKEHAPAKIINLMDALRRSVEGDAEKRPPAPSHTTRRTGAKRARHLAARRRKAS